jgi:hypothetical protein
MHTESGATRERQMRVLIVLLACLAFCLWFAYDGWIGYPRENQEDLNAGRNQPRHARLSIQTQRSLAAGFVVLSIIAAVHLIRVLRTRAVLDDQGMVYNRGPVIGWDQMTALDCAQYEAKGWVDLVYESGGRQRRRRLDSYHLARFDDLIDELCRRKGFRNPLPEPSVRPPAPEEPQEDEDAPPTTPAG